MGLFDFLRVKNSVSAKTNRNDESFHDILVDISQHSEKEWKCKARNKTIGRNLVLFDGKRSPEHVWWCNRGYQSTSTFYRDITGAVSSIRSNDIVDIYDKDGVVTHKNIRLGRILSENNSGHYTCKVPKGEVSFEIINKAQYNQVLGDVVNLHLNTGEGKISFKTIKEGLDASSQIKKTDLDLEKIRKEKERLLLEQKQREEQHRKEQEKKRLELQRIADEERKRQIEAELQRKKEEEERLKKEEEERQRQLDIEAKKLEEERNNAFEKYTKALSFIRNQATLRNNPILDPLQNDIKFCHVHDGTAVLIDGGPGTGKTTTLIQRLKLLISEDALVDYRLNEENCKITDNQIQVVTDERHNWKFFSPNALLLQYLRSNMQYEGLEGLLEKTVVWDEYLKKTIRTYYQFAGADCPFEFKRRDEIIFTGDQLDLVRSFTSFYIQKQKERILEVRSLDISQYRSWKAIGERVTALCQEAESIKTTREVISLLSRLARLQDETLGGRVKSVKMLMSSYSQNISLLASRYLVEWKQDKKLFDELSKLVITWQKPSDEEEIDEDEVDEDEQDLTNVNYLSVEFSLTQPLKTLLQKLALNTICPGKEKISGKSADLYKIVKNLISVEHLKEIGELAFLKKYVAKIMKPVDVQMLRTVTSIYKEYRKVSLQESSLGWNLVVLDGIIKKNRNKVIYHQEQALLLGFINNLVIELGRMDSRILNDVNRKNHKYIDAYKECRIPVIGVDECTDYSMIDYYAIASLRDNRVSSITLSGDVMQCMKTDGIIDWQTLKCPEIFPEMEVGVLKTSYRQSPELMTLAEHLYQITLGHPSPYDCHISASEQTPRPLWLDSDDIDKTAVWMADRILEVHKAYGQLPSIAIFTKNADEARLLKDAFDEISALESAGIDVYDCSGSNANLKDNDKVRIFSIDNVKGMEFDVVFFYNIDSISWNTDMINKYLYVALSRAAFFMAVSSDGSNDEIADMLKSFFVVNGDWSSIIDAYKDTSVAISDSSEE